MEDEENIVSNNVNCLVTLTFVKEIFLPLLSSLFLSRDAHTQLMRNYLGAVTRYSHSSLQTKSTIHEAIDRNVPSFYDKFFDKKDLPQGKEV
jgi:hypothetical protein